MKKSSNPLISKIPTSSGMKNPEDPGFFGIVQANITYKINFNELKKRKLGPRSQKVHIIPLEKTK